MGAAGFYRAGKDDVSSDHGHSEQTGMSEELKEDEAQTQSEDVRKIAKASKPVRPVKKELLCSDGHRGWGGSRDCRRIIRR